MDPASIVTGVGLIVRLGIAVYEAVKSGDTGRTVGEIFADVSKDETEIERLDAAAAAHFAAKS